jgi:hypothetical protein
MKCFRHQTKDAVGVCKSCSKGLCEHCAVDHGIGLSCSDSCEAQVHKLNSAIDQICSSISRGRTMSILGVILFSIVGIFMITIGITDERLTLLFVPGGILVLLISLPLLPTALSA